MLLSISPVASGRRTIAPTNRLRPTTDGMTPLEAWNTTSARRASAPRSHDRNCRRHVGGGQGRHDPEGQAWEELQVAVVRREQVREERVRQGLGVEDPVVGPDRVGGRGAGLAEHRYPRQNDECRADADAVILGLRADRGAGTDRRPRSSEEPTGRRARRRSDRAGSSAPPSASIPNAIWPSRSGDSGPWVVVATPRSPLTGCEVSCADYERCGQRVRRSVALRRDRRRRWSSELPFGGTALTLLSTVDWVTTARTLIGLLVATEWPTLNSFSVARSSESTGRAWLCR